jgi:hypothetical protein
VLARTSGTGTRLLCRSVEKASSKESVKAFVYCPRKFIAVLAELEPLSHTSSAAPKVRPGPFLRLLLFTAKSPKAHAIMTPTTLPDIPFSTKSPAVGVRMTREDADIYGIHCAKDVER